MMLGIFKKIKFFIGFLVISVICGFGYYLFCADKDKIVSEYAKKNIEIKKINIGKKIIDYDKHEGDMLKIHLFKKSIIRHFKEENPGIARNISADILARMPYKVTMSIMLKDETTVQKSEYFYDNEVSTLPAPEGERGYLDLGREEIYVYGWLYAYLNSSQYADEYNQVSLQWSRVYLGGKEFSSLENKFIIDRAIDYYFRTSDRVSIGERFKWLVASM